MKKALFSIFTKFISPLAYLFTPPLAYAQIPIDPCPKGANFDQLCNITGGNFGGFISNLITAAFVLAALIALAFLIYGGIKWITSGGDKTAVEAARNTLVAAIIGLVVVFMSYFILGIVLGLFGVNLRALEIPRLTP